jgi:hypothetical protein
MTAITRTPQRAMRLSHLRPATLERYELKLAWATATVGLVAVGFASLSTVLFLN